MQRTAAHEAAQVRIQDDRSQDCGCEQEGEQDGDPHTDALSRTGEQSMGPATREERQTGHHHQ